MSQVNHIPTSSYALESQHGEAGGRTIMKYYEHGEREEYLFPVQSQPVKGLPLPLADGSMPWKTHVLDDDRLSDKAPNLELALGAERKPLSLGIEPLLVGRIDHKVQEERIHEEARKKKAEEDVSASLSLSLSFPFPEKEVEAKSEQQLMSQRKHVNTSSRLLFGNLRDD